MPRLKKVLCALLALVLSLGLLPTTLTAQAASVEKVYMISFPRDGEPHPDGWGHPALSYMGGWGTSAQNVGTIMGLGSYTGTIAYCIEPGISLHTEDELTQKDENFWDDYPDINPTIAPVIMRSLIGRIFQYGYTGTISTAWRSNNAGADNLAEALATQYLVWETIVGERDSNFQHVGTGGYNRILDMLSSGHPLYGQIMGHYNRIEQSVQRHSQVPSFFSRSSGSAQTVKLEWNGSNYSATLTDTNGVLGDYHFSSSTSGVSFSVSGNRLTISMDTAPAGTIDITANKENSNRRALITWTDGNIGPQNNGQRQDLVTYGQVVTDPVQGFLKAKVDYGKVRLVKTSEDGVVENISFTVSGNGVNKNIVTGPGGVIEIPNLSPGVYTITENNISRYEPQSTQRVTVVGGQTSTVNFNNTLKRGGLKVTKTSEDGLVEGVKFHLFGTSLAGLSVDEYATTDPSGVATFSNVLISGNSPYTLEEVGTATRYVVPPSQTAVVNWKEVTGKTFTNILKKFTITATKSDVETGTAQGDASLAGAVYGVYKGGSLVDTYTTNADGSFTTREYVCGDDWTVREISPSTGYLLNDTVYPVGASAGNFTIEHNMVSNDMTEQVVKGRVSIVKHCDDGETQVETPEKGAQFEVYRASAGSFEAARDSERDTLTCDEAGFASSKLMPYGVYTIHQVSGWEGHELIGDFKVHIAEDGRTYPFIINNAVYTSKIEIVKKDRETGKIIPAAGIGFKIRDLSTLEWISQSYNYPTPTTLDIFYTDVTGKLMLPEELPFGNYELVEQSTAYGYVLDSTPVPFSVDGSAKIVTVEKSNIAQKGKITVSKQGEVFYSATEADGVYQPVYQVQGLAGAVYDIIADEEIRTLDGTVRASEGDLVATIETGSDGNATTDLLYLGRYRIFERQAPGGMVLNPEPQLATLNYAGQTVEVTDTSASFYNERQKVKFHFEKSLETDELFGIGNNGEIERVSFGLFAAQVLTAADGTQIPADALLEIAAVGPDGNGSFTTDLPLGEFYLQEVANDEHYQINDQKYPVTFDYRGQGTTLIEIRANDGVPIENILKRGKITGLKTDQDGFELAGALIGLFSATEDTFTEDTALMTTKSNEIGYFEFDRIPVGNWVVREIAPPSGFVLTEQSFPVSITEDNQVLEIEMENRVIRGSVEVLKTDANYPENLLSGAQFSIYVDIEGNGIFDEDVDLKAADLKEITAGVYRCDNLVYGKYFLHEEKAPEFFEKDDGYYPFQIEKDGAVVAVENEAGKGFMNQAQTGKLKIIKTAEDDQVEGRFFRIVGKAFTGQTYDEIFKTDAAGEIMVDHLRVGEYSISEVADDNNVQYVLPDSETVEIRADDITAVLMHNRLKTGKLQIFKTDGTTDKPLAGCGFEILNQDKEVIAQGYTDENGIAEFGPFIYGEYFYREFETADPCYKLDDTEYPFAIHDDGETVKKERKNDWKTGTLEITKTDAADGKPIPDCGFEILDQDGNVLRQGRTDEHGVATFETIPYGDYFYREFDAPSCFVLDETAFPFSVREDGKIIKAVMTNRVKTGTLEITKKDVATGKPIAGCGFEILDKDGTILHQGRTDKHGVAKFEALPYGDYFYREFEAVEGYRLDETRFPFSIREDGEVVKAEMTNEAIPVPTMPKTGDDNDLPLYAGLGLLSLAAIAGLLLIKRKKGGR